MVLALDVYHHFDYPEKMLAAIHKALKPDGRLVIVEYYKRQEAMAGRPRDDPYPPRHAGRDQGDRGQPFPPDLREGTHSGTVQYMLVLEKELGNQ